MEKQVLFDFIIWLEDNKNFYLTDLYYHGKTENGTIETLDETKSITDEYLSYTNTKPKIKKLVYGVGIDDSINLVKEGSIGTVWRSMLQRCYSKQYHRKFPSYEGCEVCKGWITFSGFKAWMEQQDWEGKHLDKVCLYQGNRVYSPDTCVFVSPHVNLFITETTRRRGPWPIGVSDIKKSGKFRATCNSYEKIPTYLGTFDTPEEAHKAWLAFKLEQAKILASEQTDQRVAKALIGRYENYKET